MKHRIAGPEQVLPPLPSPIPLFMAWPVLPPEPVAVHEALSDYIAPPESTSELPLAEGCYLLCYAPHHTDQRYYGTLRLEQNKTALLASGDLYLGSDAYPPTGGPVAASSAGAEIPIFPRAHYRSYVRVTQIQPDPSEDGFIFELEFHGFIHEDQSWQFEGAFTAFMMWTASDSRYTSEACSLSGIVRDHRGQVSGHLGMTWVSTYLRRAVIEIDRVPDAEIPIDNGSGLGWVEVFNQVGWAVSVCESDSLLQEPDGSCWSDAALHEAMLRKRDSSDLDAEWRYHLLCVRHLDNAIRGKMYDAYGSDSNKVPREGAAIASHWEIPDEDLWGSVRAMRFGQAKGPYFRTAVHELGHAMGLFHNTDDNGFMNTTGAIALDTEAGTFPHNIRWAFAPDDAQRLRHLPDPWVRPGMIFFGQSHYPWPVPGYGRSLPQRLQLDVSPLQARIPLGAPVRINLELLNQSKQAVPVLGRLRLKSGHISGVVRDAAGTLCSFWPLMRNLDEPEVQLLDQGRCLRHALTLLRGPHGALFARPGSYQIIVEIAWKIYDVEIYLTGETHVMVTPAVDEAHRQAARRILTTPDLLLTLAFGGDHLPEGLAALQAGLDNPILRPHFAVIEAKRLGKRPAPNQANLDAALALIDADIILSIAEIRCLVKFIEQMKHQGLLEERHQRVVTILLRRMAQLEMEETIPG